MVAFSNSRSIHVAAPPAAVRALVDDLRAWQRWSPWEGLDPQLERTYNGPERGVGARYAWRGNKKAGTGSMEVTAATPEEVVLALAFGRRTPSPWRSSRRRTAPPSPGR